MSAAFRDVSPDVSDISPVSREDSRALSERPLFFSSLINCSTSSLVGIWGGPGARAPLSDVVPLLFSCDPGDCDFFMLETIVPRKRALSSASLSIVDLGSVN